MDELKRHKRAFAFFRKIMTPFLKRRFNYSFDDMSSVEGPYLLLANHNVDLDPMFVGAAAGNQLYFVASEHIMRGGLGTRFLMRYFKPIIHTKGSTGIRSSMEILKTLRAGSSVCLFPEGNRSFTGTTGYIPDVTGKLARRSGVPLVTFRLEGGYLTQPRWGHTLRRGKMRGRLVHVYSTDELHGMSDSAVTDAIRRDLYENAYETQAREHVEFKGRHPALGLESAVFACPECGMIGTLKSSDSDISCECGFRAVFTPYGELRTADGTLYTIDELDRGQREILKNLSETSPSDALLFSDAVKIEHIGGDHAVSETVSGTLGAYGTSFAFNGTHFSPEDISGAAIYSRNVMIVHIAQQKEHYEIRGSDEFCAVKYLYYLNLLKGQEE